MRANRVILFSIGLSCLGVSGCSPDLTRSAGSLEIRWLGVDPTADTIRATLDKEGVSYSVEAETDVAAGRLGVESVPSGPVVVLGESLAAGRVLQSRSASGDVPADGLGIVVVDLGEVPDGGTRTSVDGVADALVHVAKHQQSGVLAASARFSSSLESFIEAATSVLGHAPARLEVLSADVRIAGSSDRVTELDRIWDGTIELSIGSVVVGRAPSTRASTLDFSVIDATPATSTLLDHTATVVLSGPPNGSGDGFEVDLRVEIRFSAE